MRWRLLPQKTAALSIILPLELGHGSRKDSSRDAGGPSGVTPAAFPAPRGGQSLGLS